MGAADAAGNLAIVTVGVAAVAAMGASQEYIDKGFQTAANAYLDKTSAGQTVLSKIIAIGVSLAVTTLEYTVNPLVYQQGANFYRGVQADTAKVLGMTQKMGQYTQRALSLFLQPSISGFPIYASSEKVKRQVDVSEEPLIKQEDAASPVYVIDNAVPRPREYTVEGYLFPLVPGLDAALPNRPTLFIIRKMLDAFASSRRPVYYKTHDLEFVKCLVTSFDYEFEPNVRNALKVSFTLKEYIPLSTTSDLMNTIATTLKSVTGA